MEVTKDVVHVQESEQYDFDIKLISHDDNKTIFRMKSAPAIINTIRRIILDETPTIAPDTVVIHQNTTVMYDELLAQRLGLIPIAVDPRKFDYPDENINEYNTIVYVLDVTAQNETITIHSGDLQFAPIGGQLERLGNVRPIIENIPIIKLGPHQRLKLELYCHKGIGKVHSKWCPCSVAFFRMNPIFKFKGSEATLDQRSLPQLAEIKEQLKCPKNVFNDLEDLQLDRCTLCRECLDTGIQIFMDDTDYTFIIEPTGYLNGIQIMREALSVLKTKAQLVVDGLM